MKLMVSISRRITFGTSEKVAKETVVVPNDKTPEEIVKPFAEEIIQKHMKENSDKNYHRNHYSIHTLIEHNELYFTLIDLSGRRFETF